jgi:cytochrome c553
MPKDLISLLAGASLVAWAAPSIAADTSAGKSAAQKCIQCHEADDWEGEDAASLESLIRDIVAGKVKHKQKLELSTAEITSIAAYWGSAGKK